MPVINTHRDISLNITQAEWSASQRVRGVLVHIWAYTYLYFDGHAAALLHAQAVSNPCVAGKMGNIIERALSLALSGQHSTIRTIRAELHTEGFTHRELATLSGRELQRQLRALMTRTKSAAQPTAHV